MKSLVRLSLAGLAGLMLIGSVEAMPIATRPAMVDGVGVQQAAVVVTKVIRRRPMMMMRRRPVMMMRHRPMIVRKTIIRR